MRRPAAVPVVADETVRLGGAELRQPAVQRLFLSTPGTASRTLLVFMRDWLPLIGLLVTYELMRDLVPLVGVAPRDLMGLERWLGEGSEATLALQAAFYQPSQVSLMDFFSSVVYFLHFVLPAVVGVYLWFDDRHRFQLFAASLLAVSFLAFLTYVALPTLPPWLGHPQDVHKVIDETIHKLRIPGWLVGVYSDRDYNVEAAFPSLHSAFPLIAAVHVWARNWRLGVVLALWTLIVWVSVVYLGEHYVVDVMGGVAYAVVAMLLVVLWHRVSQTRTGPLKHARAAGL